MAGINNIEYDRIVTPELSSGAIHNDHMDGFREDYLVLHCLLRLYKPSRVLEVGTSRGVGTRIICNAVPDAEVMSLDLPDELAHLSDQRTPPGTVGCDCKLPYTQLWGDSRDYDYDLLGDIDAFFIDGDHDYEHVTAETKGAFRCDPKIIVYHDCDIPGVWRGVVDACLGSPFGIYRVPGTRMGFVTIDSDLLNLPEPARPA